MWKNFGVIILTVIFLSEPAFCAVFEGGVEKTGMGTSSIILDSQTNMPVENVKITLPKENFTTYTDANGAFNLSAIVSKLLAKTPISSVLVLLHLQVISNFDNFLEILLISTIGFVTIFEIICAEIIDITNISKSITGVIFRNAIII